MEKIKIQQVIDEQPKDVDVDALMEKLHVLQKIEIAEKEIAAGRGITHEDVKKRLGKSLA